jgi:hypothetical protein
VPASVSMSLRVVRTTSLESTNVSRSHTRRLTVDKGYRQYFGGCQAAAVSLHGSRRMQSQVQPQHIIHRSTARLAAGGYARSV